MKLIRVAQFLLVGTGNPILAVQMGLPVPTRRNCATAVSRRTARLLRVNTVCQSTGTFVNSQQILVKQIWHILTFKWFCPMDLSKGIFFYFCKQCINPDQTPQNTSSLFIYRAGFCFANLHQTKLAPPKFNIVLSKGISRIFANGVDSYQNAESDQGHHCLRQK